MGNINVLYRLLAENVDLLLWESEASDQAKQLGLSYAGFGYWKDSSNHVVARTVGGKLVKLAPGEKPDLGDDEYHNEHEPDEQPGYSDMGYAFATQKPTAEKAMVKLTTAALEYLDFDPATLKIKHPEFVKGIAKSIVGTAITGKVVLDSGATGWLQNSEEQELKNFLQKVVADNKDSKLVSAIYDFGQLKAAKAEPKPEPKPEIPAQQPQAPQVPQAPQDPKAFGMQAAQLIGLKVDALSAEQKKIWDFIMNKAEKAETLTQLNYVRKLMKSAKLLGKDDQAEWSNWKKLQKFIKAVKQLKAGPKVPGKIKNKFKSVPQDEVPPVEPEEVPQEIPTQPQPEPEKFPIEGFGTFFDSDANAIAWFKSLSPTVKGSLKAAAQQYGETVGIDALAQPVMWQADLAYAIHAAQEFMDPGPIQELVSAGMIDALEGKKLAQISGLGVVPPEEPTVNPITPIDGYTVTHPPKISTSSSGSTVMLPPQPTTPEFDFDKGVQDFGNLYSKWKTGGMEPITLDASKPPVEVPLKIGGTPPAEPPELTQPGGKDDGGEPLFMLTKYPKLNMAGQQKVDDGIMKFMDTTGADLSQNQVNKIRDLTTAWMEDMVSDEALVDAVNDMGLNGLSYIEAITGASDKEIAPTPMPPTHSTPTNLPSAEPAQSTPNTPQDDISGIPKDTTDWVGDTVFELGKQYPQLQQLPNSKQKEFVKLVFNGIITGDAIKTSTQIQKFIDDNELGTALADETLFQIHDAKKKLAAGEPISKAGQEEKLKKSDAVPDNAPPLPTASPSSLFQKALNVGNFTPSDFTPAELENIHQVIQASLDIPSTADAKKLIKDLAGKYGLPKLEYKALYDAVFTQRAEKYVAGKDSIPLANVDIPVINIKAAETSMTKPWSKGDPTKIADWIKKTIAKEPDPKKTGGLKWQAAALVKYHGLDPAYVMDILPDDVKTALAASPVEKSIGQKIGDWYTQFIGMMQKAGTPPHVIGKDSPKILHALTVAVNTGDLSKLDDLLNTTNLQPMQIEDLKDMVTAGSTDPNTVPLDDEDEEEELIKQRTPKVPGEKPAPTIKVTNQNAADYLKQYLGGIGMDWNALGGEKQVKLIDSVKEALNVSDEFGVMYHLSQLVKNGVLDQDTVDALTFEILTQKEEEGTLDHDPEGYKKYLDSHFAVDEFLKKTPGFAASLTPEEKEKLYQTAAAGLSMKGSDGYQKSKAFYQQELVGKIPGFNDEVFRSFRNSLMAYHDSIKAATQQIAQKKAEIAAKKKAEQELQKALDALGKGDTKQQIDSLINAAGLSTLSPQDQMKAKVAVMKALTAPTSQDAMDELDALRGVWSYRGGHVTHYGSFSGDLQARAQQAVAALPSTNFNLLKKLVASQYKLDQDQYTPTKEKQAAEPVKDRAKRVFRNWLKKSGFSVANFPSKEFSHDEKGKLWATVEKAIMEPNPQKVNPILNDLHTNTSINDPQLKALKQFVHAERQEPESLKGLPVPDSNVPLHSPNGKTAAATTSQGGQIKDKEFIGLLTKYGVPPQKWDEAHDAVVDTLAYVDAGNKVSQAQKLKKTLMNLGMDENKAKNLSNAVTRVAIKGGPLVKQAINYINTKYNKTNQVTAASAGAFGDDQKKAKEFLHNVPSHQDPFGFAKNEWVKGEKVKVGGSIAWSSVGKDDSANAATESKKQDDWRNKSLNPDDNKKYNWAADSWQEGSQWVKSPEQRKAINHIMQKTIEGPPPMMTEVNGTVQRGLRVRAEDFGDFIAAFELGKRVYIGPSGFSSSSSVATGFSGAGYGYGSGVSVLFRVRPPKTGKIKAGRIASRAAHPMFGHEQEMVLGTNNNTRVADVIKHVVTSGNGVSRVAYEIVMDYDDSINEAVESKPVRAGGFSVGLWRGVPRNTIKMLIKYMNGPQSAVEK